MNSTDGTICVVAHFEPTDKFLLGEFGDYVASPDWAIGRSANRGGIDKERFAEFVCLAAGERGDFALVSTSHSFVPVSRIETASGECAESPSTLRDYTHVLLSHGLDELADSSSRRCVIGINLLCFEPKERHYDQVILALKSVLGEREELNCPDTVIVLMVHGSRDVVATQHGGLPGELREFIEGEAWKARLRLFDYERRACYELDWAGPEPSLMRMPIGDDTLFGCLDVRDKDISDEFVFRTNVQIGHFRVGKSHIRTHYDMREFVKKDFARERVLHELRSAFDDMGGDVHCERCVMVVGIHEMALYDLASSIRTSGLVGSVVVGSERSLSKAKDRVSRCEQLIILADVVHTGETMGKVFDDVREIWKESGVKPAQVRLLSVARMSNSPDHISGTPLASLIIIRRPFYSPSDCPLCLMAAPVAQRKLKVIKKPEKFKHEDNQLTPFDFWEMVGDRKALVLSADPMGGKTWCRVSTVGSAGDRKGIVNRYYVWLRGLVKERLRSRGINPGDIQSIVTVAEKYGRMFARLVADALDLSWRSVMEIPRDEAMRDKLGNIIFGTAPILLVDDGINSGGTFEMLAKCIPASQVKVCVVLDNRLDDTATKYLCERCGFGTNEVIALYGWHSGGPEATGQLENMLQRWDGDRFRYDPIGTIIDYCGRVRKGLDEIFDMNQRLYEVFCDDGSITDEGRVLMVRNLSKKEDLEHYCKDSVVIKYGKLFSVARKILDAEAAHEPDVSTSVVRTYDIKAENECTTIRGIPAQGEVGRSDVVDGYVAARTVSIWSGNPGERERLGTGFLATSPYLRTHGFRVPVLVTCRHVAELMKENMMVVAHKGTWHALSAWGSQSASSAIDLEFCSIEGASDSWDAFEIDGDVTLDLCAEYWGCTYEANKIDVPNVHTLECHSTTPSHTGTVEFRDFEVVRQAKDEKALEIDGASGSPVVDSGKRLVGYICSSDQRSAKYLTVGVIPRSYIQREMESRISTSERNASNEHLHGEPQF